MTKSLLLIGASARTGLRWAREHVYSWLILAPVVLGPAYFTALRLADNLSEWETPKMLVVALAMVFEISLIALSLSRVSDEIYHLRRPESYFDALPVAAFSHLHAALATRIVRTALVAAAAVIIRLTFAESESLRLLDTLLLCCFIAITSLSELLASLNWIHWAHRRNMRVAVGAILLLAMSVTLAGLVLATLVKPLDLPFSTKRWLLASCACWVALLYFVVRSAHDRWRTFDIEYAKRLQSSNGWTALMTRALRRFRSRVVAAQLARDLRLTLRAFSSAVYVAGAVAAAVTASMSAALATEFLPPSPHYSDWLDATWLPQVIAVKIGCVVSVVSLASLLPVLIAYQLPHIWLERAVGTTGLDIWRAKLWYARVVTSPAPLAAWLAGLLTGALPLFYALPLLAECLWLWWLVSSLMGALSFEIPTRPRLAIIVTAMLGLALGLSAAMAWPLGLIVYGQMMRSLTDRGRHRVRYYLITEDD